MKDFLGNDIHTGDTVIIPLRSGRSVNLGRAFVLEEKFKPQFAGGVPTNMVLVEWSNIHKYWFPARMVVKISDEMLPEKRREKLNDVEEGISVS